MGQDNTSETETDAQKREWLACHDSPAYFLDRHGWVYDATARGWVRFHLWPAQRATLAVIQGCRLAVILKARQLGLTWLALGYAQWLMLFRPQATVLLFSRRDDEAVQMLDFRLRGMYERLPGWLRSRQVLRAAGHEWRLSNGSAALAFPTTGGRSYSATLAVVDEADFVPELDELINAVKPTVDAGGQMVLLSTVDKRQANSTFKRIYWGARAHGAEAAGGLWTPVFLSWRAHPGRTDGWYEVQRQEALARAGTLDDLWQEYPATDLEALAARAADVRFAAAWLAACDETGRRPLVSSRAAGGAPLKGPPALPGLQVWEEPQAGRRYVIGADPAEGNPLSDDSAAVVMDAESGAEVAELAGKIDPSVFAGYLARLSEYYDGAGILVERNNHGHAVLLWLAESSALAPGHAPGEVLCGLDGQPGWLTTPRSKALMFDHAADCFRDGRARIRSAATLAQLQSIDGGRLAAPARGHDDRAMAFVLALAASRWSKPAEYYPSAMIPPRDVIAEADRGPWLGRWVGEE